MDDKTRDQASDNFRKEQGDKNPLVKAMMAEYMVSAMQSLSDLDISKVKQIALEIAKESERGISVGTDSQYLIPSLGLPLLNGYKTLAYYYVSVKMACPEMLSAIGLPYDDAYALAERMFKFKRG